MADLDFTIEPEDENASLSLFVDAMACIQRFIRDVDYAVTRERSRRSWSITKLHASAPTVTLRPPLDDTRAIDAIGSGLSSLTTETHDPPEFFTEDALIDVKRMKRLFTGRERAKYISVSTDGVLIAKIHEGIPVIAEHILSTGNKCLASLEGDLEAINLHGASTSTFTIWERVSKRPVRCYFPKYSGHLDKVKDLLDKRVTVRGEVRYFYSGIPRAITNIEQIDDATPNPQLEPAFFGCILDADAARDPVSFLRSIRDMGHRATACA